MILIHPTYFPSIVQMVAIAQADSFVFEAEDNYLKQTYRNRAYIAHSNGKLTLNVPIKHSKDGAKLKYKEVMVENSFPWQSQHWKSLQSAYRTSPFFEYYEDELAPLFEKPVEQLFEFNLKIFEILCDLIGIDTYYSFTSEYLKIPKEKDLRYLVMVKKESEYPIAKYNQVLQKNQEFLTNLSVLDLLFNEGPNTLSYLEEQKITF
jgi:hypothetical protein